MNTLSRVFALIALVFGAMFSSVVSAELKPLLLGGIYFGGDDLVETTAEDLKAGGLLYVGAGVLVEPEGSNVVFQATIGYKWDSVEFDFPSGDSEISSNPFEVTAYYRDNNFRLGGGIAYHMNPEWEFCLNSSGCSTVKFDDATGFIVEGVYDSKFNFFVGVRYTTIDYEVSGVSVDASNLGMNFGITFY